MGLVKTLEEILFAQAPWSFRSILATQEVKPGILVRSLQALRIRSIRRLLTRIKSLRLASDRFIILFAVKKSCANSAIIGDKRALSAGATVPLVRRTLEGKHLLE